MLSENDEVIQLARFT